MLVASGSSPIFALKIYDFLNLSDLISTSIHPEIYGFLIISGGIEFNEIRLILLLILEAKFGEDP